MELFVWQVEIPLRAMEEWKFVFMAHGVLCVINYGIYKMLLLSVESLGCHLYVSSVEQRKIRIIHFHFRSKIESLCKVWSRGWANTHD